MLTKPRALLLDFGGVITDGQNDPTWTDEVAGAVCALCDANGIASPGHDAVVAALVADDGAVDDNWGLDAPTQRAAGEFWYEVLAARWPEPVRELVRQHGVALSRRLSEVKFARNWQLRPGMAELLADAAGRGLPMAVVSNTLCGALHREYLDRMGFGGHFAVQLYSDEEGVRKPNPEMVRRATAALDVDARDCWFVGDTLTRDVLVARRAGVGTAIRMRSLRVERPPHPEGISPDAEVADPIELHALLTRHW